MIPLVRRRMTLRKQSSPNMYVLFFRLVTVSPRKKVDFFVAPPICIRKQTRHYSADLIKVDFVIETTIRDLFAVYRFCHAIVSNGLL